MASAIARFEISEITKVGRSCNIIVVSVVIHFEKLPTDFQYTTPVRIVIYQSIKTDTSDLVQYGM